MSVPQPSADGYIHNPHVPEDTEDLADGLYLHPDTPVLTVATGGETKVYVAADRFMEVQKERDEYRRLLALINAWRITSGRTEAALTALLARVGEGADQAKATLEILRWVQSEQMARQVRGES